MVGELFREEKKKQHTKSVELHYTPPSVHFSSFYVANKSKLEACNVVTLYLAEETKLKQAVNAIVNNVPKKN